MKNRRIRHGDWEIEHLRSHYSDSNACFLLDNWSEWVLRDEFSGNFLKISGKDKATFLGHEKQLCEIAHLVPEIFWNSLENLAQEINTTAVLSGLKSFRAHLDRFNFVRLNNEVRFDLVTPRGTQIRPYQAEGISALLQGSLILADDAGLGKSLMVLWAYEQLRNKGPLSDAFLDLGIPFDEPNPMIILVPDRSWADRWLLEYRSHIGEPHSQLIRINAEIDILGWGQQPLISIIPATSLAGREERFQRAVANAIFVVDEFHLYSPSSRLHKALSGGWPPPSRTWLLGSYHHLSPRKFYSAYKLVRKMQRSPDYRATHTSLDQWKEHFSKSGTCAWKKKRLEQLRVLQKGFCVRRCKTDVAKELPPVSTVERTTSLGKELLTLYRQLAHNLPLPQTLLSSCNPDSRILRLLQFTAGALSLELNAATADGTPKTPALLKLIRACSEQKIVIWSNWPKVVDCLFSVVSRKFKFLKSAKIRDGLDKVVNESGEQLAFDNLSIIVANADAASRLSDYPATVHIHHDYLPDRGGWNSTFRRANEVGAHRPVTVYTLLTKNTMESEVVQWLDSAGCQ